MAMQRKVMAKKSVKRTQRAWKGSAKRGMMLAKPRSRAVSAKLGASAVSKHYHITITPKSLAKIRLLSAGKRGQEMRLAGKKLGGPLSTLKWLINKNEAVIKNSYLQGRSKKAKAILTQLGSVPRRQKGDLFVVALGASVLGKKKTLTAKRRPVAAKKMAAKKTLSVKKAVKKSGIKSGIKSKMGAKKLGGKKTLSIRRTARSARSKR